LQESVENDQWGKGYRIATGKFQKKTPLSLEERREAVAKLFPIRPIAEWPRVEIGAVEPFTTDELRTAALKLRPGKAPGPDGIPPEVIRLLAEVVPRTLLSLMNGLFAAARFPDEWKRAKLVLIPKAKSVDRKKLRPICLLDCLGKLYRAFNKNKVARGVGTKRRSVGLAVRVSRRKVDSRCYPRGYEVRESGEQRVLGT
jgi:hypothetical protein